MSLSLKRNSSVEDYKIKTCRLCIPFNITANATPASKVRSSDLDAALTLATEGQTSDASAIDSGTNFTTPVDATGIFGILLSSVGTVKKLLKVEVIDVSTGSVSVSRKGASSTGVTASGNIAVSVDSDQSLATTEVGGTLCVDFIISKE